MYNLGVNVAVSYWPPTLRREVRQPACSLCILEELAAELEPIPVLTLHNISVVVEDTLSAFETRSSRHSHSFQSMQNRRSPSKGQQSFHLDRKESGDTVLSGK